MHTAVTFGDTRDDVVWTTDAEFLRELMAELRSLATKRLASGCRNLSASSLVQETFIRLLKSQNLELETSRLMLQKAAARAMRFVIVDHVRASKATKRFHQLDAVALDYIVAAMSERSLDILELHEALNELGDQAPELAEIVELRFFGDLSLRDIAELMNCSKSNVHEQWCRARQFLYSCLHGQ